MQMNGAGTLIPRRLFLGLGAASPVFIVGDRASGQSLSWNPGRLQFSLAREIKNAVLLAIAPDRGRVCLWFNKRPIGRLKLRVDGDQRSLDHDPLGSGVIGVLEIDTGKEIFSAALAGEPMEFSFFLGGDVLYGVTEPRALARKLLDRMAVVVDVRTSEIERLAAPVSPNTAYYSALRDRALLGVRGGVELVRAEWPSLRELASTRMDGRTSGPSFTGDRQRFIHRVDQSLICRGTEDLGVVWNRQIDASIDLSATLNGLGKPGPSLSVAYTCFSADGTTAAIGARRVNNIATPVEFYVEILNGSNGTPIARWPKNPDQGIALSPDGKLLAIAELVETRNDLEPTVRVHEVPSAREVTRVVHDRVPLNRRLGGTVHAGRFGFTADGKYLITANDYKIKMWQIERG